ncbi:MAG: hypothetical protein H7Z10_09630 [Gemmatimonadaceae bacterium]|nr:hypothetical protein [Acetobacteraceae bacterium]
MKLALVATLILATSPWAGPVFAQSTQQRTQPTVTQNQSQVGQNQAQQPSIARDSASPAPTATENSVTKPQGPVGGPTSQGPAGRSQ